MTIPDPLIYAMATPLSAFAVWNGTQFVQWVIGKTKRDKPDPGQRESNGYDAKLSAQTAVLEARISGLEKFIPTQIEAAVTASRLVLVEQLSNGLGIKITRSIAERLESFEHRFDAAMQEIRTQSHRRN
jgi:hypothetical protein